MPTEVKSRKVAAKSEDAELQRQFAEVCARLRRIDVTAALLILLLAVASYALAIGLFDLFAGASRAGWVSVVRWSGYAGFVLLTSILLLRTLRCAFRRINPYFVATKLEQTLPDAKNSLINWLDLRDEDLPSAFRKNLSASAAEHFGECDPEQMIPQRKNWIMLGSLAVPALGLLILLVLGPPAFSS